MPAKCYSTTVQGGKASTPASLESMLTSVHGTTRYMAPEVIRCRYTFAADIWSVGCTVLEMLTGVMPFSSLSNDFAVMRRCVPVAPPTPPPPALERA